MTKGGDKTRMELTTPNGQKVNVKSGDKKSIRYDVNGQRFTAKGVVQPDGLWKVKYVDGNTAYLASDGLGTRKVRLETCNGDVYHYNKEEQLTRKDMTNNSTQFYVGPKGQERMV